MLLLVGMGRCPHTGSAGSGTQIPERQSGGIVTARRQRVLRKVAGEWAKAGVPPWQDLIEEVERWTYGDEMKREADAVAFLRFAVDRVDETKLLL